MTLTLLEAMPSLLRVLSSAPHPDEVAAALVDGPGRSIGAASAAVLWAHGPNLIVLGLHGYSSAEVDGLDALSLDSDYTIPVAFREGETLIEPIATLGERYPRLLREGSRWPHTVSRFPDGTIINAPIVSRGHSIGAYAFTCAGSREWSALDRAMLGAISSALGLWMSHPDSGLDTELARPAVSLSDRQLRILALVEKDRTNSSIAAALGLSESTVKQELRRIMVLLSAPDRAASARRAREFGLLRQGT